MKILHLNKYDIKGGASRAAYRIHRSLLSAGIQSRMMVDIKDSGDWTVDSPVGMQSNIKAYLGKAVNYFVNRSMKTHHSSIYSMNLLPSSLDDKINKSDIDLVNLHWLGYEFLSIEAIGRIKKPIVWTFHDMWAFCGAEHYVPDTEFARFRSGYSKDNRPDDSLMFDINRWMWNRKQRAWKKSFTVVAPSNWLAKCTMDSKSLRGSHVKVIPNAIDTSIWRALSKKQARSLMNISPDIKIIMFCAVGGSEDPRKGFDLLFEALNFVKYNYKKPIELYVLGQSEPLNPPELGFPVHWLGHLHDDLSLNVAYSASDVLVLPSRQDNLPNTGLEALASGTPVVAFNAGGLPDIVEHQKNGWLAKAFDPKDMGEGICWVLQDDNRHTELCSNARQYALTNFAPEVVAKQYITLYESIIGKVY